MLTVCVNYLHDGSNILSVNCLGTHMYWPDRKDERISFGGAEIRKLSEEQSLEIPGLIKRRLEVLAEGMLAWHVVYQYHFTRWQDRNLQPKAKHILSLCNMVKANLDRSKKRKLEAVSNLDIFSSSSLSNAIHFFLL